MADENPVSFLTDGSVPILTIVLILIVIGSAFFGRLAQSRTRYDYPADRMYSLPFCVANIASIAVLLFLSPVHSVWFVMNIIVYTVGYVTGPKERGTPIIINSIAVVEDVLIEVNRQYDVYYDEVGNLCEFLPGTAAMKARMNGQHQYVVPAIYDTDGTIVPHGDFRFVMMHITVRDKGGKHEHDEYHKCIFAEEIIKDGNMTFVILAHGSLIPTRDALHNANALSEANGKLNLQRMEIIALKTDIPKKREEELANDLIDLSRAKKNMEKKNGAIP